MVVTVISPEQLSGETEHSQQVALFCWCALQQNKYLKWIHAIPNANSHKQVSEGVRGGVADIFLPVPMQKGWGEMFAGLYIELKVEKRRKQKDGGLSQDQIDFGKYAIDMGYQWRVCYGWKEASNVIEEYLKAG